MLGAFTHGLVLAFALILPFGPQNTFVLNQGVTAPRWTATWPVILTAALSDSCLIAFAVAGVSLVVLALPALKTGLSLLGILFLLYMGYKTWTAPVVSGSEEGKTASWTTARRVRYSLSVSLFNPHAIMDTVVIIGGGAALYATAADKWAYAGAAMLVSWLWFTGLTLAGRGFRRVAAGPVAQRWVNRASAGLMWAVAVRTLWQLARHPA
jgi:L-lysine exporter family protein LysE/ArgO